MEMLTKDTLYIITARGPMGYSEEYANGIHGPVLVGVARLGVNIMQGMSWLISIDLQ